jgi:hypothetical protein
MPFAWRSCRQHDDAARAQVSFLSPKCFFSVEGAAKIDDEHVTRDGRCPKVVLGMMDLRSIDAAPTPAAAREQDVLWWHIRGLAGRPLILDGESSFG